MGTWLRSEPMEYISIIMSEAAAPSVVKELGSLGCLQFSDLNPGLTPFQRRYVNYIRRCDEIERKIRFIHDEMKRMDIGVRPAGNVDEFIAGSWSSEETRGNQLLDRMESSLGKCEDQLSGLNKFHSQLHNEFNAKAEYHEVLVKARTVFSAAVEQYDRFREKSSVGDIELSPVDKREAVGESLIENEYDSSADLAGLDLTFSNFTGVINSTDRVRFERMVFRSTRGNCFVRFSDVETRDERELAGVGAAGKTVFMILYKSAVVELKLKRICDAFSARRFQGLDLDRPSVMQSKQETNYREMVDAKTVLDKNTEARFSLCVEAAQDIEGWLWTVRREKAIYHTLNLFKHDVSHIVRGKAWVMKEQMGEVKAAILRAHGTIKSSATAMVDVVKGGERPTVPTHFVTSKYTDAFQEFVNTYGVPRYREINPALFTAATFPFLFGVMYGDIGHGSCLAIGGLFLILTESRADARGADEMTKGLYSGRYMFFMMGLCAIYAGVIYNDFFSLGLDLFGSSYEYETEEDGALATKTGEYGDSAAVYPFGADPAWKISENELLFFNSMKMKMSVILGITQMVFGICLRGLNSYTEKNWLDLYCEFLPMLVFAVGFFGYMVVLIFTKWSINWDERMAMGTCGYNVGGVFGGCSLGSSDSCYDVAGKQCTEETPLADMCPLDYGGSGDGCQPPNLITTLIGIVLQPGSVDEPLYEGQAGIQNFLLALSFIAVPWLLLAKPLFIKREMDKRAEYEMVSGGPGVGGHGRDTVNPLLSSDGHGHGHDDHGDAHHADGDEHGGDGNGYDDHGDFTEIVIHQAIETIEFVLGMVSNTASYLRLWALSLAHTELASVFWEKCLLGAIESNNPLLIFIGFAIFAMVTIGVLLCMDVLECFLHALRLHWVEFQSKFYKADGVKFAPYSLKAILGGAILE